MAGEVAAAAGGQQATEPAGFLHGWEGPMLKLLAPPAGSVGGDRP